MPEPATVARVLIDSPLPQLDRLFDYSIPEHLRAQARPGVRVKVPLRSAGRIAEGFIIEVANSAEYAGILSELDSVLSPVPVLAPEVYALARRLADRAAGNASDIIRLAVPKRQVRVEKSWLAVGSETASHPPDVQPRAESAGFAEVLAEYDIETIRTALEAADRLAMDAIPKLVQLASGSWIGHWALALASLSVQTLSTGRSAIIAVPDYRDLDQVHAALAELAPADSVARLDASQSNPHRYRALLSCLGKEPRIIIGNRSVVYAPAANLGLIAVWDDGDPLHSEPLSPYVHARDAALVRQEQQACALVLAAHTRSAEVQRLVELGWLTEVLPIRAYSPKVIPTSGQSADNPSAQSARIPSTAWRLAREALEHGPVLVQVASPGFAPRLACETCRHPARCEACQGPLAMASSTATPACQWCGMLATNWRCSTCEGTQIRMLGQGSERTAEDLGRAFPGVRIIVSDGKRRVMEVPAAPALVVATRGAEPIAAGGYHAVLLLDGERMLAREALRVGEDCLRWWANAAALAARSAPIVLVGVGGALASSMATWRFSAYASSELSDRRQLRFPPAIRVATVVGNADAVDRAVAAASAFDGVDVLGPTEVADGVRAIVRMDYGSGSEVAAALKAVVIRNATTRRKRVPGGVTKTAALPTLKVRFDDTEPFVD